MTNAYSTVTLIKHYGWHARDLEAKHVLAKNLLQVALKMAEAELPDYQDLHTQLRRDIAELNHLLGSSEEAVDQLTEAGYGFNAGDIYLEKGEFREAFKVYKQFHRSGRFKIHWRLWRCAFLLEKWAEVLSYIEDYCSMQPNRVITQLEARALAVATVRTLKDPSDKSQWLKFDDEFPNCARILHSKIGPPEAILALAERWTTPVSTEKLNKRLIGKRSQKAIAPTKEYDPDELETILEKAKSGVWDIPEIVVETATTVLRSLASSNAKLVGTTVVEYMAKGLVHPIILDSHKDYLSQMIDIKLAEFERTHGLDLVSKFRDRILVNFGFYEPNEVSDAIRAIILSAESDTRTAQGLPARGEGWLAESEMVRLLTAKLAPHELIRQYSPDWLQGLRFDAYVGDFKLAVEYQGEQHFRPVDLFGGEDGFNQTIERDTLKRNLAAQNGVAVEYVTYEQEIDKETSRIADKYLS